MDTLTPDRVVDITFGLAALVLVLFIALMIHELGHFLMARLFGVPVKSVQIGHGREYFSRTDKRGTQWRIRLFPLGAHVDLAALNEKPFWQRALVIAGGPLVNLAVPFLLFPAFFVIFGQPSAPPVLVGVDPERIAGLSGLEPGDRVLAIDGVPILNYKDIWREGYENGSQKGLSEKIYKIQRSEGANTHEFDVALEPEWTIYEDDGIKRAHPRFGILWGHEGYKPFDIYALDGINVRDNETLAGKIFQEKLDRPVLLTIKGPDEKEPLTYKVHPRAARNLHIGDKSHREYKVFFLGDGRNFYLRKSTTAQISDGIRYAAQKIGSVAMVPFQILPIDPWALRDEDQVGDSSTRPKNYAYSFTHGLALGSILIALVNLLPLPRLDGGYILIHGIEAARRKPLSLKAKAKLFVGAFLLIYLSVMITNIDNVRGYIDSRLKKVHELVNWNRGE